MLSEFNMSKTKLHNKHEWNNKFFFFFTLLTRRQDILQISILQKSATKDSIILNYSSHPLNTNMSQSEISRNRMNTYPHKQ